MHELPASKDKKLVLNADDFRHIKSFFLSYQNMNRYFERTLKRSPDTRLVHVDALDVFADMDRVACRVHQALGWMVSTLCALRQAVNQ